MIALIVLATHTNYPSFLCVCVAVCHFISSKNITPIAGVRRNFRTTPPASLCISRQSGHQAIVGPHREQCSFLEHVALVP